MTIADYERLLARLDDALDGPEAHQRRRERAVAIAECEERLLQQQADLVHAAGRLHLPAPPLTAAPAADATEPVNADDELRQAGLSAATASTALTRAESRARRAAFLPTARPRVRNAVVYALCALAGAVPQGVVLNRLGMPNATAAVFVLIPLVAFLVGLVAVGPAGTARLRPPRDRRRPPLRRDAKTGAIICGVIGLAAGLAWLSVL